MAVSKLIGSDQIWSIYVERVGKVKPECGLLVSSSTVRDADGNFLSIFPKKKVLMEERSVVKFNRIKHPASLEDLAFDVVPVEKDDVTDVVGLLWSSLE